MWIQFTGDTGWGSLNMQKVALARRQGKVSAIFFIPYSRDFSLNFPVSALPEEQLGISG